MPLLAAGTPTWKTTATIAAGDIQISKDYGTFANPGTLPAETPAGSGQIKIVLTATEMNADVITIRCHDVAGAEWDDTGEVIYTTANAQADALLDRAAGIETGNTFRQAMRAILAVLCGVRSGVGTASEVFKAPDGTTTRLTVSLDGSFNRTATVIS